MLYRNFATTPAPGIISSTDKNLAKDEKKSPALNFSTPWIA